jgi:hypothetical protein
MAIGSRSRDARDGISADREMHTQEQKSCIDPDEDAVHPHGVLFLHHDTAAQKQQMHSHGSPGRAGMYCPPFAQ